MQEIKEVNVVDDATKTELLLDYTYVFHTMGSFDSREELINWVRERALPLGIVVVVKHSDVATEMRRPRIVLACERSGFYRASKKKMQELIRDSIEGDLEEATGTPKRKRKAIVERKTGTKKNGCPFSLKGHFLLETNQWCLSVTCGYHNHPVAMYLEGHAFVGRLTNEEEGLVANMTQSYTRPKQILATVQKRFPLNKSTISTIYNIRQKHKYVERAGRSQMQYLLGKLEEHGYYQHTRRCEKTDVVKDLFYANPMSVQLLRAFPNVILMDTTFKTNRYRLPLFEIVGVTSTNITFSIACAYIEKEREENYTWALTVLKGLMDQKYLPTVILTDRKLALMNAIQTCFPTSHHLLCRWHINCNIAVNCKKNFRTKDEWDSFIGSWHLIASADTEHEYNDLWERFQIEYSTHSIDVNYIEKQWINPYKERFLKCWTNRVMHFDNTTTNRAEGAHAKLKRFLRSSMGTIETVWVKMHDLYETSLNAIKASFEKSVYVVQHRYKSPIFQFLRGMVSIAALEKMLEKMKNVGEYGVDPLLCGCMLRSRCGLSCAHEIDDHLRELKPISIDKVDKFWRKLDMNPLEGFEINVKTDIMNRWKEMLHVVETNT